MIQMHNHSTTVEWRYNVPGNTERIVITQRQDGICQGDQPTGRGIYSTHREVLLFGQWMKTGDASDVTVGHLSFDEAYHFAEMAWHKAAARVATLERLRAAERIGILTPQVVVDAILEDDGGDVGFTTFEQGCNACAPEFVDGKPVYPRIEPRGKYMCCVKCGGSYGEVPQIVEA